MKLFEYIASTGVSSNVLFTPGDFIIFANGRGIYLDDDNGATGWLKSVGIVRDETDWKNPTPTSLAKWLDEEVVAMDRYLTAEELTKYALNEVAPVVNDVVESNEATFSKWFFDSKKWKHRYFVGALLLFMVAIVFSLFSFTTALFTILVAFFFALLGIGATLQEILEKL